MGHWTRFGKAGDAAAPDADPQTFGGRVRLLLGGRPGLARLTAIRLTGQFGDGMFQAALAGAILFDPTKKTNPLDIAAGFIVLLVPYSVIGPYAGAVLDRWDRRGVLLIANLLRALLIGVTAITLFAGIGVHPLLVLALATVGVSRFVLAGISASLPHVVPGSWLVPTNSVLATVSAGVATLGATTAGAITAIGGHNSVTNVPVAVAVSAAGSLVAAAIATRFHKGALGPDAPSVTVTDADASQSVGNRRRSPLAELRTVAGGLRQGAVAVWRAPGVTTAMVGIAAHRIVFGIDTLIMVLVMRAPEARGALTGGLVGFGLAVGATAAGMFAAAVVTPLLTSRLGRPRTVALGLTVAVAVQGGLVIQLTHLMLLIGAFLLGLAGQTIKLTGDAAMQLDIDDSRRGHVFALQDTVFNIGFVVALGLASLVVPADGHSPTLVLVGAGAYLLGLICVGLNSVRFDYSGAATTSDEVNDASAHRATDGIGH